MTGKIIKKENLDSFLLKAGEHYEVYAPKSREDYTILDVFGEGDTVAISHRSTRTPLKSLFLPQSEKLFSFRGSEIVDNKADDKPRLIFGSHPCDAVSLMMLDRVFDDTMYPDTYYLNKRERSTIFTLACYKSEPSCFCTAVGGSPAGTDGSDLIGTLLGDRCYVEVLTEKGTRLIEEYHTFFDSARDDDHNNAIQQAQMVADSIVWKENISFLKEKLDGMFDHPLWDKIHLRCLGCGICTYLCPTCYCFDITDEVSLDHGRRVRSWDSCMYSRYTLHASGHNPRPTGKERWRQRFLHKFQQTVERYGITFCVGCGRCVKNCPVNIDIRDLIEQVKRSEKEISPAFAVDIRAREK